MLDTIKEQNIVFYMFIDILLNFLCIGKEASTLYKHQMDIFAVTMIHHI